MTMTAEDENATYESAPSKESESKELEVLVAEMEHRIRGTVLRIIRPALDQVLDLNNKLEEVRLEIRQQDTVMDTVIELRHQVLELSRFPEVLNSKIVAVDDQVRVNNARNIDELALLRLQQENSDKKIEEQTHALQKQSREAPRLWEEIGRLERNSTQDLKRVMDNFQTFQDHGRKFEKEMRDAVHELNRQRELLHEEITGDGKGLNAVMADMVSLRKAIEPIPALEKEMENAVSSVMSVVESQSRVAEELDSTKTHIHGLFITMEHKIAGMREEFNRASNSLVSHHASLMKDIRNDYQAEMLFAREAREAVAQFQEHVNRFCHGVSDEVKKESQRIDWLHRELTTDIDEAHQHRKKDRLEVEEQLAEVWRQTGCDKDVMLQLRSSVDHVGRVCNLVLEGGKVAGALQVQDYADRCGERWLCAPSDQSRGMQPPMTMDMLEKQRLRLQENGKVPLGKSLTSAGAHVPEELVQLDVRKGVPRSGYMPGKIPFNGGTFDRRDLLILHHRLLQKAQAALVSGLLPSEAMSPRATFQSTQSVCGSARQLDSSRIWTAAPEQPSANGGTSASSVVESLSQGDDSKGFGSARSWKAPDQTPSSARPCFGPQWSAAPGYPSHDASSSAYPVKQRPGSQGQPQAMGSRGSMSGNLGETAPQVLPDSGRSPTRHKSPLLKLPILAADSSGLMTSRLDDVSEDARMTFPPVCID